MDFSNTPDKFQKLHTPLSLISGLFFGLKTTQSKQRPFYTCQLQAANVDDDVDNRFDDFTNFETQKQLKTICFWCDNIFYWH